MQSLKNNIVFITGASSGIGEAAAKQFASIGAKVIITARRQDKLNKLAATIKAEYGTAVLTCPLDVTDKTSVQSAIENLPDEWQQIDILLNNAGLALDSVPLQNGNIDHWETMINTNVMGLLSVTHAVLQGMLKRQSGHIINISSIAGHGHYPTGNVYSATKHAVRALSHSLRLDLLGTKLRVSDIAPGAVETEFSIVRWNDKEKADSFYQDFTPLVANDIAEGIVFCATRKPHVNIAEMVIYPTDQASMNHLYKNGEEQKSIFD